MRNPLRDADKKAILYIFYIGLLISVTVAGCFNRGELSAKGEAEGRSENPQSRVPAVPIPRESTLDHLVFVTESQACKCTMERNRQGIDTFNRVIQEFPGVRVARFDYSTQKEAVDSHLGPVPVLLTPVLLFLGPGGELIERMDGFFDPAILKEKLAEISERSRGRSE